MRLKIIEVATVEPISLPEAKLHIRKPTDDEDELIESLIKAAREDTENFTGRALATQIFEYILDEFPDGEITLPMPPLQNLEEEGIVYKDKDGIEATWEAENYIVDSDNEPAVIIPAYGKSYPTTTLYPIGAIRIRYKAGYIFGEGVIPAHLIIPKPITQAMLLIIGHLYENREEVLVGSTATRIPLSAESLLGPYRIFYL